MGISIATGSSLDPKEETKRRFFFADMTHSLVKALSLSKKEGSKLRFQEERRNNIPGRPFSYGKRSLQEKKPKLLSRDILRMAQGRI
jgi:hypothetical protein